MNLEKLNIKNVKTEKKEKGMPIKTNNVGDKSKTINVKVTAKAYKDITDLVAYYGVSYNSFANLAIREYLQNHKSDLDMAREE